MPDNKQAFIWYKKAAEQGNAYCQYQLCELYYAGQGVEQNYDFSRPMDKKGRRPR